MYSQNAPRAPGEPYPLRHGVGRPKESRAPRAPEREAFTNLLILLDGKETQAPGPGSPVPHGEGVGRPGSRQARPGRYSNLLINGNGNFKIPGHLSIPV